MPPVQYAIRSIATHRPHPKMGQFGPSLADLLSLHPQKHYQKLSHHLKSCHRPNDGSWITVQTRKSPAKFCQILPASWNWTDPKRRKSSGRIEFERRLE